MDSTFYALWYLLIYDMRILELTVKKKNLYARELMCRSLKQVLRSINCDNEAELEICSELPASNHLHFFVLFESRAQSEVYWVMGEVRKHV